MSITSVIASTTARQGDTLPAVLNIVRAAQDAISSAQGAELQQLIKVAVPLENALFSAGHTHLGHGITLLRTNALHPPTGGAVDPAVFATDLKAAAENVLRSINAA
ncbi:MAG: hypothetical protein JWM25_273 [Thermoleophilia bacterium]|nr:hypothetical protein [Thermoleophilia bacterium]MCZ4495690.1 hypothetical protein [Thermoleophilia bacterium]